MAFDLAHTWPFSASWLDFAIAYAILSGALIGIGVLIAFFVGDALDGPVRTSESSLVASSLGVSSVGVGVGVGSTSLIVGRLPSGDDVLLVAALRGRTQLEAALWAAAAAEGWLRPKAPLVEALLHDVEARTPLTIELKRALADPAAGVTLVQRLQVATTRLMPVLKAQAEKTGLARTAERRAALTCVAFAGAGAAVVIGFIRAAVTEGGGDAGNLIYSGLTAQIAAPALLSIVLLQQHRQARAYLRWLDGAVDAVREDVQAGKGRAADAVLIAALDGFAGLGAWRSRLGWAQ